MNINPLIIRRRRAYDNTFNNPEGEKVLADLKRFCSAVTPTADVNNVYATYVREGRREVFLRIQAYLNMSEKDVYNLIEAETTINE